MTAWFSSSKLQERWSGLEASEQRLLKVAAPLVALMLAYLLIWQPLQAWRANQATHQQELEQNLARLKLVGDRLTPVVNLDKRQWLALAASAGLRDVELVQEGDLWVVSAQVASPARVKGFLNNAAEKGWHWQSLTMQDKPLQLKVELRPLGVLIP